MNLKLRLLITLAVMFITPQAFAQAASAEGGADETVTETDATDEDIEDADVSTKNWSVNASVATAVGSGTFSDPSNDTEYADEVGDGSNAGDRWNLSWSAGGSYTFLDDYTAGASLAGVQWLTTGGGRNDSGEYRWQDISSYLAWSGYSFGDTGLSLSADLSFVFPLSNISQTANLIVGTGAGAGLTWSAFEGALTLTYGLNGGKDFHSSKTPSAPCGDGFDGVLFRQGESLSDGSCVALDGYNSEWSLVNSFGASILVWENLRFSANYSLSTFWSYASDNDDEFTADQADAGRGVGQLTQGSLSLSYAFRDLAKSMKLASFGATLGLRTAQSPMTADNSSFSFPFWNFDSAADNSSSIRFAISASY